jgi:glycosyltransferase involved in cell wall biosynthesis
VTPRPIHGAGEGAAPIRIAYLTTSYPEVSHTFIRREIAAMERRGAIVLRFSIRTPPEPSIHPADVAERHRTFVCLEQPRASIVAAALRTAVARPIRLLRSGWRALRAGIRSDRGVLRHLAYLVEAAVLLREVERAGVDHVHVHFGTNATMVALLMRSLGGPPFSFTVHGPDEFDAPIALAIGEKVAAASFVVAITSFCRAQLQRWSRPEDLGKIHVVRCGVTAEFLDGALPVPDVPILLTIGRLSPQKGHLTLLHAMRRLVDRGVEARLVIAGDGELRGLLKAETARLGLSTHVRFAGAVSESEVRWQLVRCRALVMASSAEGLPAVIMEAMAMKRVAISTMVGGIPELVRPGRNGWLVPSGDEDALAAAMQAAIETPISVLREMGESAQADVRSRHAIEGTADALLRLVVGDPPSTERGTAAKTRLRSEVERGASDWTGCVPRRDERDSASTHAGGAPDRRVPLRPDAS